MLIDKFGAFHYPLKRNPYRDLSIEPCNCIAFPLVQHPSFSNFWYFISPLNPMDVIICSN